MTRFINCPKPAALVGMGLVVLLSGAAGDLLLEFDNCRNQAMGLFDGESEGQMAKDPHATGAHLADFMSRWAEGAYSN